MSSDKSVTTAVIRFRPNKVIEVELDGLKNVHPRAISIANHQLMKAYLGKRAQHNAEEHRKARDAQKAAEREAEIKAIENDEARDEELKAAAEKKLAEAEETNKKLAEEKAARLAEIPVDSEPVKDEEKKDEPDATSEEQPKEPAANDETAEKPKKYADK